ncbi:MAG: primosomal protein N' [Leptospiraceae bacterium]|nr:primosomal protein N' [Leptospiraceae bacterium]MDW8305778.1 primosomal protein N' [Leptospiraceae bacterium]
MFAHVYVGDFVPTPLWYSVPEKLQAKAQPYSRVIVDVEGERKVGLIVSLRQEITDKKRDFHVKPILRLIDKERILSPKQIELAQKMANYYFCSLPQALFTMLPTGQRDIENPQIPTLRETNSPLQELNQEQESIIKDIFSRPPSTKVETHLLYGVTGSGKTRLYVELIRKYLEEGLGAILLLPEITVSYHIFHQLEPLFPNEITFLHSKLSISQRLQNYKKILEGKKKLVVGTRSAIFAPVKLLSLVIVDEEHDSAYKEHRQPKYNARHIAYWQLELEEKFHLPKLLLLGSATPSLESYYFAQKRIFAMHQLTKRATGATEAHIHVPYYHKDMGPISPFLKEKMEYHLYRKRQVMLILNRRGYSNYALCKKCETTEKCPHCSVSLTYHRQDILKCHFCGFEKAYNGSCTQCRSPLLLIGSGTQKIEDILDIHFPNIPYIRVDQDSIHSRDYLESILRDIREQKIQIIVGTQMIAKGFDLPELTLVGILNADTILSLPDFRSSERTFQLLVQAAGRSGRHEKGEVVIQTMLPDHPAIFCATHKKYRQFYEQELVFRKEYGYPPFRRLVRLLFLSREEENLKSLCEEVLYLSKNHFYMRSLFEEEKDRNGMEILGPVAAPFAKIKDFFRYHLILKAPSSAELQSGTTKILELMQKGPLRRYKNIQMEIDRDPMELL